MSRQVHRFSPLFVMLFICTGSAEEPPKKLSPEQIGKLVEQLGSSDFSLREKASHQLRSAEEALPELRKAARSSDLEVRRHAKELIGGIERELSERFLREAVARVNEEGLDLFVDRMVLQKDYANETHWKAVVEVARALSKEAEKYGASVPNILNQNWLSMGETATCLPGVRQARVRVDGGNELINSVHNCLFVSSGSLEGFNSVMNSILLVDGDIKSLNGTRNSILICSGTIKSFNSTRDCIIFCNGDIGQMNSTVGNALFVRGELRSLNHTINNVIEAKKIGRDNFRMEGNNTFLNRQKRDAGNRFQRVNAAPDKCVAADPSPLTMLQFFDPARAGLTHSMIEGDARIDKLLKDKPFALAGLRKNDRILAVDGAKFIAADVFSQLLRRRIVAGKALLKVQRGDRVLEIPVTFEP